MDEDIKQKVQAAIAAGAPQEEAVSRGMALQAKRKGVTPNAPAQVSTPPIQQPTQANSNPFMDAVGGISDFLIPQTKKIPEKMMSEQKRKAERTAKEGTAKGDLGKAIKNAFEDTVGLAKTAVPAGLELGALFAPVGQGISALIKGGAAAGAVRGISQSEKPENLLPEIIGGAIGGAVGGGVVGAGGKVLSKVGDMGKNLALKSLRPSKTQVYNFGKETGQKLEDFIVKNRLFDKGVEQVDKVLKPLQDHYDDLAIKTNAMIPTKNIFKKFAAKIDELESIPTEKAQQLMAGLQKEEQLMLNKYKSVKNIPIKELTVLRRTIDDLIPDSKFNKDPIVAGVDKNVRDIYKQIIDESTGGKTKELGSQLKRLYAFRELAELQDGLGKGNLPVGLLGSIAGFGGAGIGAGAGYATGGQEGAIKGALLGLGFTALVNNPKAIGLATKILLGIGNKAKGDLPPIIGKTGQVTGAGIGTALPSIQAGNMVQVNSKNNNPTNNNHMLPIIAQTPSNVNTMGQDTQVSENPYPTENYIADITRDPKNRDYYKQIYDTYQKEYNKPPVKKSVTQQARDDLTYGVDTALEMLQSATPPKIGILGSQAQIEELKSAFNAGDEATIAFNKVISELMGSIAKARGGTAFTPNEQALLERYAPKVGDSDQQILIKLQQLKNKMDAFEGVEVSDPLIQGSSLDAQFPIQ